MAPKKKQKKAAAPEAEILDPEVVLKEVRYVSVPLTLRVCLGSGSRVCRCAVEEVRCGWQQGSDISAQGS